MRPALLVVLALASGCGTYSLVRSADTMPAGRVELSAGMAASALGEVNTIIHGAYAITDDVEVLAQNEVWNTFAEVRYGVLHSDKNGVGVTFGAGAGQAITLVSAIGEELDPEDANNGAAALVSAWIGKRLGTVYLTLGNRTFFQFDGYMMSSTRAAARLSLGDHFGLMAEGGGTAHAPLDEPSLSIFIAEASAGFWVGW